MVFNSLTFAAFFAVVLLLHRAVRSEGAKKSILLAASYAFYAAWNPPFVILLWVSTLVDWHAARAIAAAESAARKRVFLGLSLATNLGLLGFFKYGGFALDNLVVMLAALGVSYSPPAFDVVLPVGISFYTFQTLSYTLDVYRGDARPWPSPLDFALFVTFFPQLVAGPIVRASQFLPQCASPARATLGMIGWGGALLTLGLFEKTVLADALLSPVVELVYAPGAAPSTLDAWVGTLAFAGQIFCDFAGYSTCAIGAALCLGYRLPDNFRFPYAAVGFRDFWRRWHISLSTFLRDYLYISLGGNRRGSLITYRNLALTMLLGGLWHGASWNFVIWGGLHGVYLAVERILRRVVRADRKSTRALAWLGTFYAVTVAWVFFRAADLPTALALVGAMHAPTSSAGLLNPGKVVGGLAVVLLVVGAHLFMRERSLSEVARKAPRWALVPFFASMWLSIVLFSGSDRAFIYFQF